MIKTVILLLLATLAAAQRIDRACNPDASPDECVLPPNPDCNPDQDPDCVPGDAFLECVALYNQFDNGTCRCAPGLFWNPFESGCRVGAEGPCTSTPGSAPCTRNAECTGTVGAQNCTCDEGYYPLATGSYCVAGFGRPCGDGQGGGYFAQCDHNLRLVCGGPNPDALTCVCAGEYMWSPSRGKCLSTIQTSSSCAVDDDCVDNAVCGGGNFGIKRCNCAPGFRRNAINGCSISYREPCNPATVPTCNEMDYLTCNATSLLCDCPEGRQYDEFTGKCVGRAGDVCSGPGPTDCVYPAACHSVQRICICSQLNGLIELPDRTCGRLGRAGGYCRVDTPGGLQHHNCNPLEYLRCVEDVEGIGPGLGRCECQEGMNADADGRCIMPLAARCDSVNHNCVVNSGCIRGNCTCLPGTREVPAEGVLPARCLQDHNEVCFYDSRYPDPCNDKFGLACVGGRCTCPVGQEWNENVMHCTSLVSGTCSMTTHRCTAFASCTIRGVCECAAGYSQHSAEDRRCRASHGTVCSTSPTIPPCNENQFLKCNGATQGTCECEFPQQQVWDSDMASCVSRVGAYCGEALEGAEGRTMRCVPGAICTKDEKLIQKCLCDADAGYVPDGSGGCMKEDGKH